MKIISWLTNIIKRLTFKDWLLIILFIIGIYYFIEYKKYYNNSFIQKKPTADTIYQKTNKKGENYVAKDVFMQATADLKKQNAEIYKEFKSLKENPLVITKYSTKFKIDTVYAESQEITKKDTGSFDLKWKSPENKYYSFSGVTNVQKDFSKFNTQIYNFTSNANLTSDLVEKNGQFTIMVKSDNPYLNINNINGTVLDLRKNKTIKKMFPQKKFGIGPIVGYGYDFKESKFAPFIGIGVSYNLLKF